METREKKTEVINGWFMLGVFLITGILLAFWMYNVVGTRTMSMIIVNIVVLGLLDTVWLVCLFGFFTLQPNEAAVLILFGKYRGSVKSSGFKWANPLLSKDKVSLRARNLNGETIKVNDSRGNPVEIATVVVWKVENTAKSVFDVDNYAHFVTVQSEAALRHLAMAYPYDTFEGDTLSLRGSTEEISHTLQGEIQERVARAGVKVIEARLSHLAYAEEIAGAMLQRQQAEAIVAARSRIVDGAVGMVEMALDKIEAYGKIELDEERKAAMVSNLLVVLCGHENAHPVVNTGSLYT